MRNDRFANAFRILNVDREWQANSPEAVAERRRTNRLVWIFGIVIAVFAVWGSSNDSASQSEAETLMFLHQ